MTQQQLASAVDMAQPSIARIEAGTVIPRATTVMTILEATGHRLTVEPIGPSVPIDMDAIRQRLAMDVPKRTWTALGRARAADHQRSPIRIVRRLRSFGVPFVLVGDLAEAAHGSPLKVARTIEVCHSRTDVARARLDQALRDLGTDAGRLRLATEVATGDDYDLLARTAVRVQLDTGIQVWVASLDDLIRIRLARGTPDDLAAAAVLRAIGALGGR